MEYSELLGKTALAILAVWATACSPFAKGGAPTAPPNGIGPSTGTGQLSCEKLVTQERLDALAGQLDAASDIGGLLGADLVACESVEIVDGQPVRRSSKAYSLVNVLPKIKLGMPTTISSDVGRQWNVDIPLEVAAVKGEEVEKIARALHAGRSTELRYKLSLPEFQSVLIGDLPEVRQQIVRAPGDERYVLRFYVSARVIEVFRDRIGKYENGAMVVSFYFQPEPLTSSISTFENRVNQSLSFQEKRRLSAREYLNQLYSKIGEQGLFDDREIPFLWMKRLLFWWMGLGMQSADARREWSEAHRLAAELWTSPGQRTEQVGAQSSLAALRLLTAIDPDGTAKANSERLLRVEEFLGRDDDVLYAALMQLVRADYGIEKEKALVATARKLAPLASSAQGAWSRAVRIYSRAEGQQELVDTVVTAAAFIHRIRERPSDANIDQAMSWVFDKKATMQSLALVEEFHQLFIAQGHSQSLALENAEKYVFKSGVAPERLKLLTSIIGWLAKTRHAKNAITKAEEYVLGRQLSAEHIWRIQNLYNYMQDTSRNLVALEVAEDYVLVKKLSSDHTQAIVSAHDWLARTPQWGLAWEKSEAYVLNHELSLAHIEQMIAVEQWLRNSPLGVDKSVAKAEDFIMVRKLSRRDTELIEITYLWLRDVTSLAEALDKAENYVLVRKMSSEKFRALREAYRRHKAAGADRALEKAEQDIFKD